MENCQNCGHKCHCGKSCTQEHKDGDGKNILILCCNYCRCKIKEYFGPGDPEYDSLDIDAFNGAWKNE